MDQNKNVANSELTSSTDENGGNVVSVTSKDDSLENDDVWSVRSPAIQKRVKELYSTIKDLVSQMRLQDSDDHTEVGQQNIDYYDLTQIQNMQVDELQKHLLQRGEMCRKLLADLKIQEQAHLSEIEKLNQQFKIKLSAKDEYCLELKENMEQLHRVCKKGWQEQLTYLQEDMLKKDDIIKKLSTDIENKEKAHAIDTLKLKELETNPKAYPVASPVAYPVIYHYGRNLTTTKWHS
ncbi:hypothetical protein ACLKA6_018097 [Drosophila palustris]